MLKSLILRKSYTVPVILALNDNYLLQYLIQAFVFISLGDRPLIAKSASKYTSTDVYDWNENTNWSSILENAKLIA